ncbi:MAG TPA: hypothetical protein VGP72_03505 [Planctomycetota bacterium]|jgi:hypothetical protein
MADLLIKRVDPKLVARLKRKAAKAGKDLNTYVKSALAAATKRRGRKVVFHDLDRLAGTWTQEQYDEFNAAVAPLRKIDKEIW